MKKKKYEELLFEVGRKNHPTEIIYLACLSRGISSKNSVLNYYIHQKDSEEFKTFCKFTDHCFNEFNTQQFLLKELYETNFIEKLLKLTCDYRCNDSISDVINTCSKMNDFDNVVQNAVRREIYMSRGTRMENGIIDKLATLLAQNKRCHDDLPFTLEVTKCSEKMKRELPLFLQDDEHGNNRKIFIIGKTDVRYDVLDDTSQEDEELPKVCYGEIKNRVSNRRWPPSKDNQLQVMFYMFLYEVNMMFLISNYPNGSIERNLLEWNGTLFKEACDQLKTFTHRYFNDIEKIKKVMAENKKDVIPSDTEKKAIFLFIKDQTDKRNEEIQQNIKSILKLL